MSFNGSITSHFGSDLKNMDTCCKAISEKRRKGRILQIIANKCKNTFSSVQICPGCITCVVYGVIVSVEKLFDQLTAGEDVVTCDVVQIGLETLLTLGYKLSVHVS